MPSPEVIFSSEQEKEIVDRIKRCVGAARGQFEELKTGHAVPSANFIAYHLQENLRAAGVGYRYLDPEGKKTDEEMKTEVWSAMDICNVNNLRETYASALESKDVGELKSHQRYLEEKFEEYGLSYKDLDPEGKKTDQEVKAEFEKKFEEIRMCASGESAETKKEAAATTEEPTHPKEAQGIFRKASNLLWKKDR